jgi:hypothetical protein
MSQPCIEAESVSDILKSDGVKDRRNYIRCIYVNKKEKRSREKRKRKKERRKKEKGEKRRLCIASGGV